MAFLLRPNKFFFPTSKTLRRYEDGGVDSFESTAALIVLETKRTKEKDEGRGSERARTRNIL